MDCREFQELITPAVDRCLDPADAGRFRAHREACPECRREFELEQRTKALIQHRARMVATPPEVSQAILAMVRHQQPAGGAEPWWQRLLPRSYVGPAVALAAALLALIVLWPSAEESPRTLLQASIAGPDVVRQSFANFERVVSGAIRPQLETNEPERVRTFFAGRTSFPVVVPVGRDCRLTGAVLNEYGGVPLAHTLYRHHDALLYVYQTCWQTVQRGSPLVLPDDVRRAMQEDGMYSESRADGSSIVVWTDGRTLCAAVAHMDTDELIACLDLHR